MGSVSNFDAFERSHGPSQGLGKATQAAARSDLDIAQGILQRVWQISPTRNVKACIGDILSALQRLERTLPAEVLRERPRQWTERRVRAIWCREARRIDAYEMADLEAVAEREAEHEISASIARAARMTEFLETRIKTVNAGALRRLQHSYAKRHTP